MSSNLNGSEEEEDRLSSFPDSVICHILSFLPTKDAAITSVLSTRWRYLFLGVLKIYFDEPWLLVPQDEQGSRTYENQDFINFVNRRLMLCKTASISEFRLKCPRLPEPPVINSWLTALLFRNVKVLKIEVLTWDGPPCCLPSVIYRSESLVVLKLRGGNIVLRIPEFVCFRNLKVLNLKCLGMQFECDDLRLAEEGYPLLEELRLNGIKFPKNKATLGISIPTLKVLAILDVDLTRIDIDTPNLQHLECELDVRFPEMQINFCRCEFLLSANIIFYSGGEGWCSNLGWCINLLRKVNNVKEFHLLGEFLFPEVLSMCTDYLLPFPNLTYLETASTGGSVWSLLQLAPNLKTLVCKAVSFGNILPQENEPPLCFVRTLTEIRITNFEECEDQVFAGIRFFLGYAAVLEKMIIKTYSLVKWTNFKQLLKQRRRSPKCEVEFIDLEEKCPIIF